VKLASIVEMLNVSPQETSPASPAQVSDQSPQTFKESLLAASKASSSTGAAKEGGVGTGRRQKTVGEDAKLPPTTPRIRSVLSPFPSQQPPSIDPVPIPMQRPLGGPALSTNAWSVASGQSMREVAAVRFSPIEANISHSAAAKSDGIPSSHAQTDGKTTQAASILPSVAHVSQTTTNLSNAVSDVAVPDHPSSAVLNANAVVVANVVPSVQPDVIQNTVFSVVASAAQIAVQSAVTSIAPGALPSAVLSSVPTAGSGIVSTPVAGPVATVASSPVASVVSSPAASAVSSPAASVVSSPVASVVSSPVASIVSSAAQKPLPAASPSLAPSTLAKAVPGTVTKSVPSAIPSAVQNSVSPVVPNPNSSLNAATAPVLHAVVSASAKGQVASKSSPVSTSQADPTAAAPDPSGLATGPTIPGTTADQLVALIQPGGGLFVTAQGGSSGVSPAAVARPSDIAVTNGNNGASNSINDSTGIKPHAQSATDQIASETGSQETASSGDQTQGGAAQQGQSAVPVQMSFANHAFAAVDHAQNAGVAAPVQSPPTLAGVPGHVAKTPDTPAPAAIALPQAVPVINTAKLIQSMGQSEMRVGMHSNDFGNISISTSATRDLISAQISLDHGELARTLAVHLPEMQARLGGSQAMEVRIDMNGQGTGQGMGTSTGMQNGSADGSRGDRQQKGGAPSSQSADGFAGQGNSIAAAVLPSGDARLDIRA
jgi:hypothetical protein